jgi:hypothetical protein
VILPGVLLVRRDIISKFVLWTLAPKSDMSLEMMYIAIPRAICKPCCQNQFSTPEVAICIRKVVIPALGAGIVFNGERMQYLLDYLVQHLVVCMPLLIKLDLRNIAVLDRNRQESYHYDAVH